MRHNTRSCQRGGHPPALVDELLGNLSKGIRGGHHGEVLGLLPFTRRVFPGGHLRPRLISAFSGLDKPDFGVCAQAKLLFAAVDLVRQPPELSARRLH